MSILDTIIGTANKAATFIQPHIPTLAVVGGSGAVIAGAFLACKSTLKVDQVLDEHRGMMQHITDASSNLPKDAYSDMDRKRDKLQVYAITTRNILKLYGPAVGLTAAGFASIFYGFGLIKSWHAMAVSSVAAIDKSYNEYRNEIIRRYGNEVDEEITKKRGSFHKIERKSIDENGDEKVENVEAIAFDDIVEDDFTRVFDYTNPKWENDYLFNDNLFANIQQWYTLQLQSGRMSHVFMNTIFKELGFKETGVGHFYGWLANGDLHEVHLSILPFIRIWDDEESSQFPMILPIDINNDDEVDEFRNAYIKDEKSVGYIIKFDVECDENHVPRQIYNDVYGNKAA